MPQITNRGVAGRLLPQLGFIFLKLYDAENKLPILSDPALPTFILYFSGVFVLVCFGIFLNTYI